MIGGSCSFHSWELFVSGSRAHSQCSCCFGDTANVARSRITSYVLMQGSLVSLLHSLPYCWDVMIDQLLTVYMKPYRLIKEEQGGNWLYSIDQLAPLEI